MLGSLLKTAAAMEPDRRVLDDEAAPITLSELTARARVLAARILDARADACVYVGANGPGVPLTLFACAFAGVPFAPLNYRLDADRLRALIARFANPTIIADEEHVAGTGAHRSVAEWMHNSTQDAGADIDGSLRPVDVDAVAAVLFTSGTTSAPKAVPLRHGNLSTYVLNSIDLVGSAADEAALISVPPYHVAGLGSAITNVLRGRRMVYLPRFEPGAWLDLVRSQNITSAMVVPTMLARVIKILDGKPAEVPTLRELACGGARITPDLLRRALTAFPQTGFTNAYGLTETSSTLTLLTPQDHREAGEAFDPAVAARLGSVGRAIPGVEIQVRSPDGTAALPGSTGEIWVRGPQISGEYLDERSGLDGEGWFCTRDSGYLDKDGYLFIIGRMDDTIIRGGENVAPAEIEDVLAEHPAVQDVGVVGVPDPEWGERIVAAVIAGAPGTRVEEIRDWARERLRSSRTPDEIVLVRALPYNATGKLVRRELAAMLEGASASAEQ